MNFLHVGTHKTGTTFLQQNVFPHLEGIAYLGPWSPFDHFLRMAPDKRYLLSNERLAGRLWAKPDEVDYSLQRLAGWIPGSRVLIGFRPHEGYIVSSYKQHLHEGGVMTFTEFFDPVSDAGFMNSEQFSYRMRIEAIERHFGQPPFVFLQRELLEDLPGFLRSLCRLLGVSPPDPDRIRKRIRNRGVTYQQARVLRRLNRYARSQWNPDGRFALYGARMRSLRLDPRSVAQHWLRFLPDAPFVTPDERQRISDRFADDWSFVLERIAQRDTLA